MNNVDCFNDMFESIPDYKKIVVLMFLNKNDVNLLYESGFSKGDIHYLYKKFKNISLELNEEYLDYIENEKESKIESFWKSKWKLTSLLFSKISDMHEVLFCC